MVTRSRSHSSWLLRIAVVALAPAMLAVNCENSETVRPTFGANGVGTAAFRCAQDANPGLKLYQRAFPGGSPIPVSMVVDFIALDGETECRTSLLSSFCEDGRCTPMSGRRACFDIGALPADIGTLPDGHDVNTRLGEELEAALRGRKISGDTPGGLVMVRAVASVQPCSELGAGVEPEAESLLGCAHSCPVRLNRESGSLFLGFDTLHAGCEPFVVACASNVFQIPAN